MGVARPNLEHTYGAQFANGSPAVLQAGADGIRTLSRVVTALACPGEGDVEAHVTMNLEGERTSDRLLLWEGGCRRAGPDGGTVTLVFQGHAIGVARQAEVGFRIRLDG